MTTASPPPPFQPSRADGRSDRQVIYDLLEQAAPDSIYTFDDLTAALAEGLAAPPTRERLYRAVREGARSLLTQQQRTVRVIRGVGYRVCRADEHLALALTHEAAAGRKIRLGLEVLRHVREDELSPAQIRLHRGHFLLAAGLYQALESVRRRQDRQEDAIRRILRRIGEGDDLDVSPDPPPPAP